MKKCLFRFLIALAVVLPCLLISASAASGGVTASGYCGKDGDGSHLTWTLYKDGELVINGSGAMEDFYSAPWYDLRNDIKTVTIGNSVTTIGEMAFSHCTNLTKLTIGSSVTTINYAAFEHCYSLPAVSFPASVTTIGSQAFFCCTSLTEITIPDTVTTLDNHAFFVCSNLTSVTIGDGVTTLDRQTFSQCDNLTSVTVGKGVTTLWWSIFAYNPKPIRIEFLGNAPTPMSADADAFADCTATIYYHEGTTGWPTTGTWLNCPLVKIPATNPTPTPIPGTPVIPDIPNVSNPELPSGEIVGNGKSLILKEQVYVNVYAKFNGFDGIDPETKGGLLMWKIPVTEETAVYSEEYAIPGLIANYNKNGEIVEYYQRGHGIPAKEYADEASYRVYLEIADGAYVYGPLVKDYSVQQYCNNKLTAPISATNTAQLKEVCRTMLHYGAAAQLQLNHNEGDLTNVGIEDTSVWNPALLDALATIPEVEFTSQPTTTITDNGKSLLLKDAILMKFFFGYQGDTTGGAEMLVWDANVVKEAPLSEDNVTYRKDLVKSDNLYQGKPEYSADSNGVAARAYSDTIFVCAKFTDREGNAVYSEVVAYSPETYAANKLAAPISATNTEELKELCRRMVMYGEAARIYFGQD